MATKRLIHAADIEHETGLGKDLLRVWRLRYGFPVPLKDERGEHGYPGEQIAQLRLIKRLLDAGFRPALIVGKSLQELESLIKAIACSESPEQWSPVTREAIDLLKLADLKGLDALLQRERRGQNLSDFVLLTLGPLADALGEAWSRGEVEVFQEHLCSCLLTQHLHAETARLKPLAGAPRVLLATPPDELHGLGLLMVRAVLADQGAECIALGPQVSVGDLALAVRACRPDIVALSFSFAYPRRRIRPFLARLRPLLPEPVDIWAGGAGTAEMLRAPKGVRVFSDLRLAARLLAERSARNPEQGN